MIVTELWKDGGLSGVPMFSLLWEERLKSLYCLDMVCILMDVPISSNHGVMGRIGKLETGTKKGDRTEIAAVEDGGGIGSEPCFPGGVREIPPVCVKIAHSIIDSRDGLRLKHSVTKDDGAHVAIRAPLLRGSFWVLPKAFTVEQDRCAVLIGGMGFWERWSRSHCEKGGILL